MTEGKKNKQRFTYSGDRLDCRLDLFCRQIDSQIFWRRIVRDGIWYA